MSDVSERLIKARKRAGYKSAADAARALKVKAPTYFSHENGSIGLRSQVADKYARKFKVSLDWLLSNRGPMETNTAEPYAVDTPGLPLLGYIQAGHWIESSGNEGADVEMVPIVRDPRYPHARQYALKVLGDSLDLKYPEGSIVTCVDFADSGLALGEGFIVHVERYRSGGQLVELTLKIVEIRKGKIWLAPYSSNPAWSAFPLDDGGAETEVIAKGVVLGGWSPLTLPIQRR